MKEFYKTSSLILLLSFVWLFPETGPAQTRILLKEKAVVQGPGILLSEIAQIEGGSPEFIKLLGDINLSSAPPPIQPLILTNQFVNFKLKENRIMSSDIVLGGVTRVSVYLDTVIVSGNTFENIVLQYLDKVLTDEGIDHTIEFLRIPRARPAARKDLVVKMKTVSIGRLKGNFNLQVGIYNGDRLSQTVQVPVKVRTFEEMVVASNFIPRGTIITDDHLKIITDETTMLNSDYVSDISLLVGMEANKAINAGKPVRTADVDAPRIIKRGDFITIEVVRGGITILCNGIAKKDGRLGDIIPVVRDHNKQVLYARVDSRNKVSIK